MSVWRIEYEVWSGDVVCVLPVYSLSTGAYGFFRPSVLWATAVVNPPASSVSSCGGLCGRSLLLVACDEPSTVLLVDSSTGAPIARLETEEREQADDGSEDGSITSLLPTTRPTRFKRRYGMVMSAQLYRTTSATPAQPPSGAGQYCTGCALYVVCGMESGHVAVFRLSTPVADALSVGAEQPYVLACPLLCEVKLHEEPGQLISHTCIHAELSRDCRLE